MFYKNFMALGYSAFILCCTPLLAQVVPIVTVEENNRLEELADGTGVNEWRFMTNSGLAVALEAENLLNDDTSKSVTLLIGKGYKGGNALWGGYLLLEKGYHVKAYVLVPVSEDYPAVCRKIISMFKDAGGSVELFDPNVEANGDLIIDGLVGTGFKGAAKDRLAAAINWANSSKRPILAIDIPSGVNANTGEVQTVAMIAKHTLAISFPKAGYFLNKGIKHVGTFSKINIGIDDSILEQVQPNAYLVDSCEVLDLINDPDLVKLDRQALKNPSSFEDYQQLCDKIQKGIMLTDSPVMILTPFKKPYILDDHIIQYRVNEATGNIEIHN